MTARRRDLRKLLLLTLLLSPASHAQVTVTGITFGSYQNDRNSTQGGISFRNEYYEVETLSTQAGDYTIAGPMAQQVYVRRNTSWFTGPNNTTLFYQVDDWGRAYGTAPSTVEEVFMAGNLFTGIRDPFANTGSSSYSQNSNIERIDFHFGKYVVQEGAGIVLFDLENTGNNGDSFRIAAFDGWDAKAAAPNSFVDTGLLIKSDSFGEPLKSPSDASSVDFARATYTDGNNVSGSASNFTSLGSDLNLVGVLIRFTDLGLRVGDTIQGFSLMAADVKVSSSADLIDWNNRSVYRTDTDRNTFGNVDFMGFGAQFANPVPEPANYGAIFLGLSIAFYAVRRPRLRPSAV